MVKTTGQLPWAAQSGAPNCAGSLGARNRASAHDQIRSLAQEIGSAPRVAVAVAAFQFVGPVGQRYLELRRELAAQADEGVRHAIRDGLADLWCALGREQRKAMALLMAMEGGR